MSKRNGKPKSDLRHINVLVPSDRDMVALGQAVKDRLRGLREAWFRIRGVTLLMPGEIAAEFKRFKIMLRRHANGDFRHTESEKISTRIMADWSLAVNCELRNQQYIPMEWAD